MLDLNGSREVRTAEINDIPGIISVLEHNLLGKKENADPQVLESSGFLINAFSPDEAKSAIQDKENFIFLVCTEGKEIIGYIVACDVKKLNSGFQEELSSGSSELREIISSEKTLYLRHIAKDTSKKDVGNGLLRLLCELSSADAYKYITCTIAENPIQNKVSKAFHEKNAFVCSGFYDTAGKTFGIYLKKL